MSHARAGMAGDDDRVPRLTQSNARHIQTSNKTNRKVSRMAITQTFNQKSYTLRFYGKTKEDVIEALNKYLAETPRIVQWVPEELESVDLGSGFLTIDEYALSVWFTRVSNVIRNADGTAGLSE